MLSPKTFDNPHKDAANLRADRLRAQGYDDPRVDIEDLKQLREKRDRPNPTFEKLKGLWGGLSERVEKLRERGVKSPEEQAQTAVISVEVLESQQEKSVGFFGALRKKVQTVDWSGVRKHFASSMGVLGATQPLRVGDKELQLKPEIPFWNGAKVKEALQNFAGSVREKFKSRDVRDAEAGYEEEIPELSTEDRLQELGRLVDLEGLRGNLDEFYARSSYAGGKERKALRRFADEYLARKEVGDFAEIFGGGEVNREAVRELAGEIMAEYGEERERRNQEQQAKWRDAEFNADFEKLSDTAVQRMVVEVYAKSLLESPRSGVPVEMVPVFLEGIKADLAMKDPAEIEVLMNPDASATPNKNAVLAYVQEYLTRPAPEGEVSLTPEQKSNLQKGLFLKLSSRLGQMDPRTREITKTLVTGLSTDELSQLFADLTDVNSLSREALEGLVQEVQTTTREVRERKAREDTLLAQAEARRRQEATELEQFISTEATLETEVDPDEVEELSQFFSRTDTGMLTGTFEDNLEDLLQTPSSPVLEDVVETDEQRQERWQRQAQEDEVFEERMREVEEFNRRQEMGDGLSFEEVMADIEAAEEARFQKGLQEGEELSQSLGNQDRLASEEGGKVEQVDSATEGNPSEEPTVLEQPSPATEVDTYQGTPFVVGQTPSGDNYQGEAFVLGAYRRPNTQEDTYAGTAFELNAEPKVTETPDLYQGTAFVLEKEIPATKSVDIEQVEPEFVQEETEDLWDFELPATETTAVTPRPETPPQNQLPPISEKTHTNLEAVTQNLEAYQTLTESEREQVRRAILDTIEPNTPMSDLQMLAKYDQLANPDALRPAEVEDMEIDQGFAEDYPGLETQNSPEVLAQKQAIIDQALSEMEEDGFWLRKNEDYNEAYQEIFYSEVVDYLNSLSEDRQFLEEQRNGELEAAVDNLRVDGIVRMMRDTVTNSRQAGYSRWVGKEFNKLVVNRNFQVPQELRNVASALQNNAARTVPAADLSEAFELLIAAKRLRSKGVPLPDELQRYAPL